MLRNAAPHPQSSNSAVKPTHNACVTVFYKVEFSFKKWENLGREITLLCTGTNFSSALARAWIRNVSESHAQIGHSLPEAIRVAEL